MSDMDFFELKALERASLTRQDFETRVSKAPQAQTTKIKEKVTSLPVEFPEGRNYPSFKTVFDEERTREKSQIPPMQKQEVRSKLSELLHDPEAALIGGLIMLLRSEGADEELLAALSYILL